MKTLGCLHAHYSNIHYIEKAFSEYPITLQHFVDPGLMMRITNDPTFKSEESKKKVMEQVDWIVASGVDAIVITCTNYIAILDDTNKWSIPIIKIDEPFFKAFSHLPSPQTLVFTNPKTVEGTTGRLNHYLHRLNKPIDYSIEIIPNAFEYLMNGNIKEHNEIVVKELTEFKNNNTDFLAIAQLSMVEAGKNTHTGILNPLDPLIDEILVQLHISKLK
ncbi:hypothetical protein ACIQ4I_09410 [Rummeliibacillus sp. NPDC094406]|uniref:hypothetical protein n=1 Tax=Rummeliibacillus sp. NPDC094406 TaxID=3364511 RepID=UPI0037F9351D